MTNLSDLLSEADDQRLVESIKDFVPSEQIAEALVGNVISTLSNILAERGLAVMPSAEGGWIEWSDNVPFPVLCFIPAHGTEPAWVTLAVSAPPPFGDPDYAVVLDAFGRRLAKPSHWMPLPAPPPGPSPDRGGADR